MDEARRLEIAHLQVADAAAALVESLGIVRGRVDVVTADADAATDLREAVAHWRRSTEEFLAALSGTVATSVSPDGVM